MKKQLVDALLIQGSKEVVTVRGISACNTVPGHFFVPAKGARNSVVFGPTRTGKSLGGVSPVTLDQVCKPKD